MKMLKAYQTPALSLGSVYDFSVEISETFNNMKLDN